LHFNPSMLIDNCASQHHDCLCTASGDETVTLDTDFHTNFCLTF
jgi:hypothetical protein